ncbi:MAG: hypothetical protein FWE88_04805 [Phycisphaerae bacterium]|nr:hypothetical protein [Phycisphaerae bacterium]
MIRKILLMLLTFAVLMGVFILYREYVQLPPRHRETTTMPTGLHVLPPMTPSTTTGPASMPAGQIDPGSGIDLLYTHRNVATGAMEYIFRAERYDRLPDGSLSLYKPSIQFFQEQGQLYLTGERGQVRYEQIQGKLKPNSGHFTGNVRLLMDRLPGGTYSTMKDRPEDVIDVAMQDVKFDNTQLLISTAGRVEVRSHEMDILGHGLLMRLEQAPSELRELRIERGELMVIKTHMDGFGEMMPGADAEATVTPMRLNPARLPTSPPSIDDPEMAAFDAILRQGLSLDEAGATPPVKPGKTTVMRKNTFFAELVDDANALSVESPSGQLHDVGRLAMIFDWDSKSRIRSAAAATPASQPTEEPSPTTIRWNGPLVLRPFDYTDSPSHRSYKLYARGERMKMVNTNTTALLGELYYYRVPAQGDAPAIDRGRFLGTDDNKVLLTNTDGYRIESVVVKLDRPTGRVDLIGGSRIEMPPQAASRDEEADLASSGVQANGTHNAGELALRNPEGEAGPDVTTSDTWILAVLSQARGDDGKPRWQIRQALCLGTTTFHRPSTGERMSCDRLAYMEMDTPPTGPAELKFLRGQGNVNAEFVMDKNHWHVRADETQVHFASAPDPNKPGRVRTQPTVMQANKDVRIAVTSPDGEPLVMTGDRAEGKWDEGRYELFGTPKSPATIRQAVKGQDGFNGVSGPQIVLNNKDERQLMQVIGPGRLDMLSDRGPNNEKLDKPVPTVITWTRGMNFFGRDNRAEFRGNVEMDRGGGQDNFVAQRMDVLFDRAVLRDAGILPASGGEEGLASSNSRINGTHNAGETPASRETPASAMPGNMDLRGFRDMRIANVNAMDNVCVLSRQLDDDGHLISRLKLTSNELKFDATTKTITVPVRGTLLVEDYNKPRERPADAKPTGEPFGETMIESPSRTLFAWNNRAQLTQTADGGAAAMMDGQVLMNHRSGKQLNMSSKDKAEFNVPDWGDLPTGRHSILACEKMDVEFDAPQQAAKPDATSQPANEVAQLGTRVGKLKNFRALDKVTVQDGPYQLLGNRLLFDGASQRMTMYGNLEGQPKRMAAVVHTDPSRGTQTRQEGEVIRWNVRTNEMKIEGGKTTGGR